MNPRRVAIEMWPTLTFAGGLVVFFAYASFAHVEKSATVRVVDRLAPSLAANVSAVTAPQPAVTETPVISSVEVATAAELLAEVAIDTRAADDKQQTAEDQQTADKQQTANNQQTADKQQTIVVAALTDPAQVLPETPSVSAAAAATIDPQPQDAAIPGRIEIIGECLVAETCIDQYLWALYERTPKKDTIKEVDRYKVKVKKRGKLVTVTRTSTRLVPSDFTWKDPKAAERAGMSMIDYVIGGMEKKFKLKLFYMLQAAENAGLEPGITSAFRDDYRQSIASGLKAASDRSYHGGSSRGGYGHGLAADIVSTKGATKAQRWVTTEALWKWVDANGKDFGIGRPYLDRDPPHVGPVDGQEYTSRRGGTKAAASDVKKKHASSDVKKRDKQAAKEKPAAKRPVAARSSKARST
jgi:D-alanyl-D-alanine carboxypeptidase